MYKLLAIFGFNNSHAKSNPILVLIGKALNFQNLWVVCRAEIDVQFMHSLPPTHTKHNIIDHNVHINCFEILNLLTRLCILVQFS